RNQMGDQGKYRNLIANFSKVKAYLAMVTLQCGYAGMVILTMLCLNRGLNHNILVVYRNAAATIVVAPFALIFERPVIDQNLYYMGMKYTSATFASAILNIQPAVTFTMALIFRLEKVKIKSIHSQAKIAGTIVSLGGAMIMTLYKGPIIDMVWSTRENHSGSTSISTSTAQNWFVGTLMLLGSCTTWSGFFILQSITLKEYPAELSLTSLIVFMGVIQGGVVALVMERDFSAWGIVGSAFAYYVQGVVMKDRGPVFVTAFNPLCMIIVAVLGTMIIAEPLHLGSLIGSLVIVVGLYSVIWGKSKDQSGSSTLTDGNASCFELPIAAKYSNKIGIPMSVIDRDNTIPKVNSGTTKSEVPIEMLISHK
ncbi:hypothetical protein IFM89_009804, partial [Coptis chinensis]